MSELQDVLSKIGLSENDLKVYNVVVAFGLRTIGQISAYVDMSIDEVSSSCESLVEKKYLIKVNSKLANNELGNLFIPLAPKISISGDISKRLSDRLKSLSVKVSELWEDTQGIIDNDAASLISDVKSVLNDNISIVEKLSVENKSSINEWSNEIKSELNEIAEEAHNTFKTEVTEPLVSLSKSMYELSNKIVELSDTSITEIQSKTSMHKESIETAVNSIKTELEEFADEIGFIMMGRISGLNQQLENTASEKSESGEKIYQEIQQSITKVLEEEEKRIETVNSNLSDIYLQEFDVSKEKLFSVVNNIKDKFGATIENAVTSGNTAQQDAIKGSKSLIEKYKEAQIGSVEDLQKSFLVAVKTVQKEAVTELSKILTSTSKNLSKLDQNIASNLGQHQKILGDDLSKLSKNVSKSLKIRFNEVDSKLSGFIEDLKSSSENNVNDIVNSIQEISDFLQIFLGDVSENLSTHLDVLQNKVNKDVTQITQASNSDIENSLIENKKEIDIISNKISEDLNVFQTSITDFLTNVKSDLEEKLVSAQQQFKEGVDEGVGLYRSDSARVSELQEKQMLEIEREAKNLIETADKSRKEIISLSDTGMNQIKLENFDRFKTNINSSADKFNRQFDGFNDAMSSDFRTFYDNFQNKSTGLRENVPEEINTVFTDQIDRIKKFNSDFERITNFIDQSFGKLEFAFNKDNKFNFKKEREDYYQEIIRNKDEFNRLGMNIANHFSTSINDLDMTKNDLLDDVNKTFQDELVELEELIGKKSKETNSLMDDFKNKLENNKNIFTEENESNISDLMRNIQDSISNQLLSIFQQPLDSIISKAKSVATGSEGLDSENRLIKSQNDLISSIQDAVDVLVVSLQTAFENSIQELDNKVGDSINKSESIVKTLSESLNSEFEKQNSNADNIANKLIESLDTVKNSLNENLSETVKNTKSTVDTTVSKKKEEVNSTVSEKTVLLKTATKEKLVEVDTSLDKFSKELTVILKETSTKIDKTVDTTIKTQHKSMKGTIKSVADTTKLATDSIIKTQNSLKDKVGKPLALIENEVKTMVETFNNSTSAAKEMLAKDIDGFYANTSDHLNSISDMNTQLIEASSNFNEEINSLETAQQSTIISQFEEFKANRMGSFKIFNDELNAQGDNLNNNIQVFIQELFSQMAEQLSVLQQEVLSSIENVKGNIDLTVTNSIETVRSDVLGPANEVINSLSLERDNIKNKSTGIGDMFAELEISQHSVIGDTKGKFVTTVEKSIDKESEKWKNKITGKFEEHVSKYQGMASEFESKINRENSDGKQKVTDAFNSIPTTIDETLDASAKSMVLLNEISKGAAKLEPQFPELSYFDATADAIKANLNSVLMNTKSNATIITPTLEWINLDKLHQLTRASIRIVTDPSMHTSEDTEIVKELKGSDVNISLRKLDRARHRDDISLIMVGRDREEVILAKLLTEKEPYAFVSQDEAFVEKFRVLLADYATMPPL